MKTRNVFEAVYILFIPPSHISNMTKILTQKVCRLNFPFYEALRRMSFD